MAAASAVVVTPPIATLALSAPAELPPSPHAADGTNEEKKHCAHHPHHCIVNGRNLIHPDQMKVRAETRVCALRAAVANADNAAHVTASVAKMATPVRPAPKLPAKIDLRPKIKFAVYDQGQIGSCTAHATVAAARMLGGAAVSRLFLYYNSRELDAVRTRTAVEDNGAYVDDALKTFSTTGVCLETEYPYTASAVNTKPPASAYATADRHKIRDVAPLFAYTPAAIVTAIKTTLAQGYPVIMGAYVFNSIFNVPKSGIVPDPKVRDQPIGGHALLIVGFNDSTKRFTVLNSWGNRWGASGYGHFSYAYIGNASLAVEFDYFKGVVETSASSSSRTVVTPATATVATRVAQVTKSRVSSSSTFDSDSDDDNAVTYFSRDPQDEHARDDSVDSDCSRACHHRRNKCSRRRHHETRADSTQTFGFLPQ